jgi:type I restriction enzyme R subunit
MELISRYVGAPSMQKMTKEQLVNLICSSANLIDEREDIIDYIDDLDAKGVNGKTEKEIEQGYELFKKDKFTKAISSIAEKHHLNIEAVQTFVNEIVERRIFDGEKLYDLIAPLELGWKDRARKEEELMKDLIPLLKRMAGGQKISGLSAYEE